MAVSDKTLFVTISQSGETADTLAAVYLQCSQQQHGKRVGIVVDDSGQGSLPSNLESELIPVPECPDFLAPLLYVVPLQLQAYHVTIKLRLNVDQPRNLAKSVTVE